MNSIVTRPLAFPLLVTLGLMVCLIPLAVWQQGPLGFQVVAGAGGVVLAILLVTATAQRYLRWSEKPIKQLALVGGLRMGLSLAAVLGVFFAVRRFDQPQVLLYAVPFYLGLLAAESAVVVAQVRKISHQ
jgi:hypothetical protein